MNLRRNQLHRFSILHLMPRQIIPFAHFLNVFSGQGPFILIIQGLRKFVIRLGKVSKIFIGCVTIGSPSAIIVWILSVFRHMADFNLTIDIAQLFILYRCKGSKVRITVYIVHMTLAKGMHFILCRLIIGHKLGITSLAAERSCFGCGEVRFAKFAFFVFAHGIVTSYGSCAKQYVRTLIFFAFIHIILYQINSKTLLWNYRGRNNISPQALFEIFTMPDSGVL